VFTPAWFLGDTGDRPEGVWNVELGLIVLDLGTRRRGVTYVTAPLKNKNVLVVNVNGHEDGPHDESRNPVFRFAEPLTELSPPRAAKQCTSRNFAC
jgi:hypothetical protein